MVKIMATKEYPQWKLIIWRFIRTGIAGGASTLITVSLALKPDMSNIKDYGLALSAAFIAGFIGALGLIIRDTWGNKTQTALADKLPI